MSDHQPCGETSSGTIQSSLPASQTPGQDKSGKSGKRKQKKLLETESAGGVTQARFQPYDLKSLTFKPIGSEQEVDVWHAAPEQFHAYVSQFSHGFEKVNVNIWPLAERLAFVNAAWLYFQEIGQPFPFSEDQQVASTSGIGSVPDVDASGDKSASQAV